MIISHKFRFIFLPTPKCASRAIAQALQQYYGGLEWGGSFHDNTVPPKFLSYYFLFSVVRNPYERMVSMYRYIQRTPAHRYYNNIKEMSFEGFITFWVAYTQNSEKPDEWNQADYIYGKDRWLQGKVRILRHECLVEDLVRLPLPSIDSITLPVINATGVYDWRDYYDTDVCAQLVYEWAQPDFACFNYSISIHEEVHHASG